MTEQISLVKDDKFAEHCGIKLLESGDGKAKASMKIEQHHFNGVGTVQGGAIFTLADVAFAAAVNSVNPVSVAVNINISYMTAVQAGNLYAYAYPESRPRRVSSYRIEVKDENDQPVAVLLATGYRVKQKQQ